MQNWLKSFRNCPKQNKIAKKFLSTNNTVFFELCITSLNKFKINVLFNCSFYMNEVLLN